MDRIISDIKEERKRQLQKHGEQYHKSYATWYMIIGEEMGELAQAILEANSEEQIRKELIQVATSTIAFIEEKIDP